MPKYRVEIDLDTGEKTDVTTQDIAQLLEPVESEFNIQSIRILSNQEVIDALDLEKLQVEEFLTNANSLPSHMVHQYYLAKSLLPHTSETVLINALPSLSYFFQVNLLKFNKGISTKFLLLMMKRISEKTAESKKFIIKLILSHPSANEEITWMIVKDKFKSIKKLAIPYANEDMIRFIEEEYGPEHIPSTVKAMIKNRRAELKRSNTEFQTSLTLRQ